MTRCEERDKAREELAGLHTAAESPPRALSVSAGRERSRGIPPPFLLLPWRQSVRTLLPASEIRSLRMLQRPGDAGSRSPSASWFIRLDVGSPLLSSFMNIRLPVLTR